MIQTTTVASGVDPEFPAHIDVLLFGPLEIPSKRFQFPTIAEWPAPPLDEVFNAAFPRR